MLPYPKKYKPKNLSEIAGQIRAVEALKSKPRKPLLLYGPSGTGKTSAVHALADELSAELIELNASDFRNKANIDTVLKPATQQASLFGTNKIILIDEVDSLSGTKDRGASNAIIDIIKSSRFPIYLTANDPWSSKLSTLRKYCTLISFDKLHPSTIANQLSQVCKLENIKAEQVAIRQLAAHADGDMRAALNDLQTMSTDGKLTQKNISFLVREQEQSIFNAMKLIFRSSTISAALQAYDGLNEQPEQISYWMEQNIPEEYKGKSLRDAYDCVSRSDIFLSRIMRRQYWGFLAYIRALLSAGIQQAGKSKNLHLFTKYRKPDILLKIYIQAAKRKKYRGIAAQISDKLHASARVLQQDFLPYLDFIAEKNKKMSEAINKWLQLN